MAYAKLTFRNGRTGSIKDAPVGFSWTTFFFSGFPALLRGHLLGALVTFIAAFITFGFAPVVIAFFYNKWYINHLIAEGYMVIHSSESIEKITADLNISLPVEKENE